jgi:hypothetical protein
MSDSAFAKMLDAMYEAGFEEPSEAEEAISDLIDLEELVSK